MKTNFQRWLSLLNRFWHSLFLNSVAGVLAALRRCCLQVENLDRIVTVVRNWPDDPRLDCVPKARLAEFLAEEATLAEENYDVFDGANLFEDILIDELRKLDFLVVSVILEAIV